MTQQQRETTNPGPGSGDSVPDGADSRRAFLLMASIASIAGLAGCATSKSTSSTPRPIWDPTNIETQAPSKTMISHPRPRTLPNVDPSVEGVIARSTWAKGQPIPSNMNRMQPARRITVHHDGMTPFTDTSRGAASARLEQIRRSHLGRPGERWGDIGYHYAIDPAGRLWACRPLTWQGAHVRAQNEGNIGIVMLGNYEKQAVNAQQAATLERFLERLMDGYRIPVREIRTHQEMAATLCPGRSLQHHMVSLRSSGKLS